jgi:hypothetical protein
LCQKIKIGVQSSAVVLFALQAVPVDQQIHLFKSRLFVPLHEIFNVDYGVFIVAGTSLQIPNSLSESKILIFQTICLLAEHLARLVHILEIEFVVLCLPVLALVDNVIVLAFGNSVFSHVALRWWGNTDLGTHSALCIFELNVRSIRRDNY